MTKYSAFESPPPSKVYHIIWNVLLADKQFEITGESLQENKIGHIVAILPSKDDFLKLIPEPLLPVINYTVMEYGDTHEPVVDHAKYREVGALIDGLARSTTSAESCRNVLIFCNNGYQRSMPFLVYYLTTFHPDECPTVARGIDLILPQVDKKNYSAIRDQVILATTTVLGC